jgi:hypothetical protein
MAEIEVPRWILLRNSASFAGAGTWGSSTMHGSYSLCSERASLAVIIVTKDGRRSHILTMSIELSDFVDLATLRI